MRQFLALAAKAEAEQAGADPPKSFRTPPLDPKARAMEVAPRIWDLKALGKSPAAIANELNRLGIKPLRCGRWHGATVERALKLTAECFPQQARAAQSAPNPWLVRARERASELAPLARKLRKRMSLEQVAAELTRRGVRTPKGSRRWWAMTVWTVLKRADEAAAASSAVLSYTRTERSARLAPRRRVSALKKAS